MVLLSVLSNILVSMDPFSRVNKCLNEVDDGFVYCRIYISIAVSDY